MVCFYHAVLGCHGAAFDQRQQVTLYPFTTHIRTHGFTAAGDLVDLIKKDNAVLFYQLNGLVFYFVFVNAARSLFVAYSAESIAHFNFSGLTLATADF